MLYSGWMKSWKVGCALFGVSPLTPGEGQRIRAEGSRAEVARWIWASAPTECRREETIGRQEAPAGMYTTTCTRSLRKFLLPKSKAAWFHGYQFHKSTNVNGKVTMWITVDREIFAINFFASCLGGENFLHAHLIFRHLATWRKLNVWTFLTQKKQRENFPIYGTRKYMW